MAFNKRLETGQHFDIPPPHLLYISLVWLPRGLGVGTGRFVVHLYQSLDSYQGLRHFCRHTSMSTLSMTQSSGRTFSAISLFTLMVGTVTSCWPTFSSKLDAQ